jgi:4-hydroxybenzoate polyprenyltransferase
MSSIKSYFSLVTFSHTIFALPFAVIGFFLAVTRTDAALSWKLLGLVVLCMIFARNAAMGFNRYADRDIDIKNERTQNREIPAGTIRPQQALWFVILNCIAFCATTYFINTICFYLSPVALLVVLGYSLTKRFTALCHFVLGVGLALAPIGAWLAVTGYFDWLPLLFSFAVLFWVSGFDMIYALQDEEFDQKQGLNSIPVLLGKKGALRLSELLHIISAGFIWTAWSIGNFSWLYLIGAVLFSGLLIYQHALVKPNDLSKVNRAFFTINGIASIVFAMWVLLDLFY